MLHTNTDPKNGPEKKEPKFSDADMTPRREGGDDALAETAPTDARADEKVIVNEQESNRAVNTTTQPEAEQ
jgi:hypothetical protein